MNLGDIRALLKSNKIKDRDQGIIALKEHFAVDRLVDNVDESGNGKNWLVIFQALFEAVYKERELAVKKGALFTADEKSKLGVAASAVRWLTERAVKKMNRKTIKASISHLHQTMVSHGRLVEAVALNYAKALRTIFSYRPHLEHLDSEEWLTLISLSFAVVLKNENLKSNIEDDPLPLSLIDTDGEESETEVASSGKRRKIRRSPARKVGNSSKSSAEDMPSQAAIEFIGLIADLLRCPNAPHLSKDRTLLVRAILNRLHCYFIAFPLVSRAHIDALAAVNTILEQLALNHIYLVTEFGVKIWDRLLALWGTKEKSLKEGLISAFLVLFPYVTHKDAKEFKFSDSIRKLYRALSEHESRWGMEALSFDSVRLEVSSREDAEPFVAQTFRYGYNFNANQALSWATLELKADCINELFQVSESSIVDVSTHVDKKLRLENPVSSLLHSIKSEKDATSQVSYLQVLLFVVDRHWHNFHGDLQHEIVEYLLPLVAADNRIIQSWAFLCLAAVVHSNGTISSVHIPWDKIWSNAMRRTNASGVCRAACHVAHILLISEKLPLQRILTEIEAMAQDINIQGPTAPYDSVCSFLSRCLEISNQDVRLHRMQLEEKILQWLTENWDTLRSARGAKESFGRYRMEQRTVHDILSLLQNICGLAKRFEVLCQFTLPDCIITDTMSSFYECSVIRDYLLHAKIKSGPKSRSGLKRHVEEDINAQTSISGFKQATPRERKISAFCLKVLESTSSYWEASTSDASKPQAGLLRRSLDFAVTCLLFENYLSVNSIHCNGSVITTACRLLSLLIPHFSAAWSSDESLLLLSAFLPLVMTKRQSCVNEGWEALTSPGSQTGIRSSAPSYIAPLEDSHSEDTFLRQLQRSVWQNSTVRGTFDKVSPILISMLESHLLSSSFKSYKIEDDENDFEIGASGNKPFAESKADDTKRSSLECVTALVNTLALMQTLQIMDGKPAREKILSELMCECDDGNFDLIGNAFLHHVQLQHVHISSISIKKILGRFESLLMSYAYSRSERLQLLATNFLIATAHLWLTEGTLNREIRRHVRQIACWLMRMIKDDKLRSWRSRDKIVRFMDFVLSMDPKEAYWVENLEEEGMNENQDMLCPGEVLPNIGRDDDVRVRFSAAVACARLFSTSLGSKDTMELYQLILGQLCTDMKMREHMLTRFLCLGNLMITSSVHRRGPYYHLLEICLETQDYTQHVESILEAVTQKIALPHQSDLFEAYASQLALSIKRSGRDFFKFPPHVLGYTERKEYARATFTSFSSVNLIADDPDLPRSGQELFRCHCGVVGKSEIEGLLECFAEATGFQIAWHFSRVYPNAMESYPEPGILSYLRDNFVQLGDENHFLRLLKQNLGDIAVAILRTVGDVEYEQGGSILDALEKEDGSLRVAGTFKSLMKYRRVSDFNMHEPNLPANSTAVVLYSLKWLMRDVTETEMMSLSYHILQELFGKIGTCFLINEQLRLMQCMCIWIACHGSHFKDGTLLRGLIDGAIITLAQPELSHISRGILEWSFRRYAHDTSDVVKIEDICIRICSISQQLLPPNAARKAQVDISLLSWIEEQMLFLGRTNRLNKGITAALAAWPRELRGELLAWGESPNSEDLSSILRDKSISSQKFKLIRRLSALAEQSLHTRQQFSAQDFWNIKSLIPTYRLPDEELDCFTRLLLLSSGSIQSCRIDLRAERRNYKLPSNKHKTISEVYEFAKDVVIISLLHMLSEDSSRIVHVAYETLRKIAGSADFDMTMKSIIPAKYRRDVTYLSAHPIKREESKTGVLLSLLGSEFEEASCNFGSWIFELTRLISGSLSTQDVFFSHLENIFKANESFAEDILPTLVYALLNDRPSAKSVKANLKESEIVHQKTISEYFNKVLGDETTDIRCLKSLVDTVLHLRHFKQILSQDELSYDKWLEVDYIALSRSAIRCGAFTTALLFIELAYEYNKLGDRDIRFVEQILFDIYEHLDEPDGFYGIKSNDFQRFLLKRFRHEHQWEKALQFHGAEFEAAGSSSALEGIKESLHSFGFDKLAMTTLQSAKLSEEQPACSSNLLDYEFGWRTETWDLPEHFDNESSSVNLYTALRAVHRERDPVVVAETIRNSMYMEMQRLRLFANENLVQIRNVTRNLMCLAQARQWTNSDIQQDIGFKTVNEKSNHWKAFCTINTDFEFSDLERIVATRASLLRSVRHDERRDQIGDMKTKFATALTELEKKFLIQLSQAARSADWKQIALNSIVRAQRLENDTTFDVINEFAHVLWSHGEQKLAIQQLQAIVDKDQTFSANSQEIHDNLRRAKILVQLGEWATEACLVKSDDVHTLYFKPAIGLLEGFDNPTDTKLVESQAEIYYKFGLFSELQYQSILKSPNLLRLKFYSEALTKRLKSLSDMKLKEKHAEKYKQITRLEQKSQESLDEDSAQLSVVNASMASYLQDALDMLSRCLGLSDLHDDDAVIRICSLWFANFQKHTLYNTMQSVLSRVASRKFVFLSRQLCARLSNATDTISSNDSRSSSNQRHLQELLSRMCSEHPFHCLYQLYPLQSSSSAPKSNRRLSKGEIRSDSQKDRAEAADDIINRLKLKSDLNTTIKEVFYLCDACSELAVFPIKDNPQFEGRPPFTIPSHLAIRRIAHMRIPVTTANTPLDPTLRYEDCDWIAGYDTKFETAGGLNVPKIVVCRGISGAGYKQLMKGEGGDDLRQDAVMEQVFEVCNQVLRRDRETCRRNLTVRSYKVVPLAARAGMLEFVENTQALTWLNAAHKRYRPVDYDHNKAYKMTRNINDQNKGDKDAHLRNFLDIKEHFKPVMRHFFTEHYKAPMQWFEKRLRYSRSVATTSIVGHVLGLGDRHLSNILIDKENGEVIHIDLGIAFEQGTKLPTPERVPFRMTADMVDGFGISGTEGVFRRCAEETLRVLRDGSAVIKTILEVFKYDPLHQWSISLKDIKQKQPTGNEPQAHDLEIFGLELGPDVDIDSVSGGAEHEAAERALSAVARKLDKALSVEYTVNELITEATDVENLAQMWCGWAAYA